MTAEPFAYGIQAPIGSVTPLFHKLKDAEDYIVKLTDSRDEAKIIPLYRAATLTDAGPRLKAMNDALEGLPCVSTSCPRCGLTFSETVDSSSFSADEMRAVQSGANALRVAAKRVASYDDRRDMELMADHIDAMLVRLGVTL